MENKMIQCQEIFSTFDHIWRLFDLFGFQRENFQQITNIRLRQSIRLDYPKTG